MWPDINAGGKLQANMRPSPYSSNELFAKELEDELMKYTASYDGNEVNMCSAEETEKAHGNAEEEIVDITVCTRSSAQGRVEAKSSDATESSSSFDQSDSGDENGDASGESEALSGSRGTDASELNSDVLEELFRMRRQKKVTDHWKTYIRPLEWRCRWAELQIKKLEEQAKICARKLEECQQKKVQLEKSTEEVDGVKSLPLSQNYVRNDVLRRKRRKKIEATEDVAKFLSAHNLFSYYGNLQSLFPKGALWDFEKNKAKKKQNSNIVDEFRGFDEEASYRRLGNDDSALEQLYQSIMSLQSHVGKLKSRVNKVTSENVGDFPYLEYLTPLSPTPLDVSHSSPSNTAVHPDNVVRMPVDSYVLSQLTSGHNTNAAFALETTVPSHEEDVPLLDENAAQDHFADTNKNGDNLVVYNRRAKRKMNACEEVNAEPTQRPAATQTCNNPPPVAEPNPLLEDEPPLKMRSISHIIAPAPQSKSKRSCTRRRPGQ